MEKLSYAMRLNIVVFQKLENQKSNVLSLFESKLEEWKVSPRLQSCISEAVFTYAMTLKYEVRRCWCKIDCT